MTGQIFDSMIYGAAAAAAVALVEGAAAEVVAATGAAVGVAATGAAVAVSAATVTADLGGGRIGTFPLLAWDKQSDKRRDEFIGHNGREPNRKYRSERQE